MNSSTDSSRNEEDQLKQINLQALKNRDPYITKIIDQAQRVCVYKFLAEKRQWEKRDLEGTLFVYERLARPFHGFVVLNTVSRETFVQIIKPSMEFKHTPAYEAFLQYKVDVGDIYGIWFISKTDCPRVTDCLKRLTVKAKELDEAKLRLFPSNSSIETNKNLLKLFDEARRKLDESKEKSEKMPHILERLFSNSENPCQPKPLFSVKSVVELEQEFLREDVQPRLMTPSDFRCCSPTNLSRNDMREILCDMIKNDEDFVNHLYRLFGDRQSLVYSTFSLSVAL